MALLFDLAVMTVSGAPGTGTTINLGGAATINGVTFLTFAQAGVPNGTPIDYSILDPVNGGCESGVATYSSSGPSLVGRTPTVSSNSNAAINASASSIIRISPRAETLQTASLFTTGALASAITYPMPVLKAAVYFNAPSGSITINSSFNVASLTRTALGNYEVTFTNAFADANYYVSAIMDAKQSLSGFPEINSSSSGANAKTTMTCTIAFLNPGGSSGIDPNAAYALFFE